MVADTRALTQSLAERLAAEYPRLASDTLGRYLTDIVGWNDRVGLVSKRSTLPSLERLVRLSAWSLGVLEHHGGIAGSVGEAVVDIGSGAGFPGLIWKLMRPGLHVTLVERRQKKATFLERMSVVLRLGAVEVVAGDAAEVAQYQRFSQRFALAVSFAVSPPGEMTPLVEPFVRANGVYCTLRARTESPPPAAAPGHPWVQDATWEHEQGRLCLFRRQGGGADAVNPK